MKHLVVSALLSLSTLLSLSAQASSVEKLWKDSAASTQWTYSEFYMTFKQASDACAALNAPQTLGWHLPTVNELGAALQNGLTDPSLNTTFADKIHGWDYTWTRSLTNYDDTRYLVNLLDWYVYEGNVAQPYHVLCTRTVAN